MRKMIKKLIRTYQTNCPFEIARSLGIHIRYSDLGKSTKGLYCRKLRRRFIVLLAATDGVNKNIQNSSFI